MVTKISLKSFYIIFGLDRFKMKRNRREKNEIEMRYFSCLDDQRNKKIQKNYVGPGIKKYIRI